MRTLANSVGDKDVMTEEKRAAEPALDKLSAQHISTSIWLMSRDLYQAINRAIDARASRFGLSSHACRYLAVIRDRGGATPKELSDFLAVRSPTTLAALRTLEDKRLIEKVRDASDGRKSRYILTKTGSEIETLVRRSALEVEQQAVALLSGAEVVQLEDMVRRIRGSLTKNPPYDRG